MAILLFKIDTYSRAQVHGWGFVIAGFPFLFLGGYSVLASFGFVTYPVIRESPPWAIGLAFAALGCAWTVPGLKGVRNRWQARWRHEQHPYQPWYQDYPWNPNGIRDRLGERLPHYLWMAIIVSAILTPFSYWAFLPGDNSLLLPIIVCLFALWPGYFLWRFTNQLLQFLKFGRSELSFRRFPYHPGEKLAADFTPNHCGEVSTTLRFVEERIDGSQLSYEIYSDQRTIHAPPDAPSIPIVFQLPDEPEWVTGLSATPARYWELLVEAKVQGVDFRTTLPLPIYRRQEIDGALTG